nr:hypothetical protein [uncultured Pseudogulbenkiania sp.]
MWIKLLCSYQTADGAHSAGDTLDVGDAEGKRLVDELGVAEKAGKPARAAKSAPKTESATTPPARSSGGDGGGEGGGEEEAGGDVGADTGTGE